jgi:condensin complex subunit 2
MTISDTLKDFKFSSDPSAMPDFATLLGLKDTFDDSASAAGPLGGGEGGGDLSMIQEEEADFFGGEDFDSGAPMGGGFDDFSAGGEGAGEDGELNAGFGGGVGMAGPGEHMPFDGRRHPGDLVMALVGGEDGDGMFDYFDKGFGKNWAGAEHWKLRKVTRKGQLTSCEQLWQNRNIDHPPRSDSAYCP